MTEHKSINSTTCSCGFKSNNYRGLNSHVGNTIINGVDIQAREFAERAHTGQFRWDGITPYITHPDRLAELLMHWRVKDLNIIASAYLHDVVEDTSVTIEELGNEFGSHVANIVNELTFPPNISDEQYHERCNQMSMQAAIIKLADIFANLTEIGGLNSNGRGGLGKHFIEKRLKAIGILQKRI